MFTEEKRRPAIAACIDERDARPTCRRRCNGRRRVTSLGRVTRQRRDGAGGTGKRRRTVTAGRRNGYRGEHSGAGTYRQTALIGAVFRLCRLGVAEAKKGDRRGI